MGEPRRSMALDALRLGLLWGAGLVFLALVGMVEVFSHRAIIGGVLNLGHALLLVLALAAGYQAGSRARGAAAVWAGAIAGLAEGAVAALFVVVGAEVNLRRMFVNASADLYQVVTFGRGLGGAWTLLLGGAAVAALGSAATLIPARVRRPATAAVVAVLALGVFQDLAQLLLQTGWTAWVNDLLFSSTGGLSVGGATAVFVAAAVVSVASQARRERAARQAAAGVARSRYLGWVTIGLGVAAVLALPAGAGLFGSQVLVLVGLYTLMGLGLNLEIGFAGLLDLGFAAFFAIGAYTVGLMTSVGVQGIAHWPFWAAVPVAVLVAGIAGIFFGLPILRIRGDYLAIATLGFGEIIRLLALSDFLRPWLGGSQGLLEIPKPVLPYPCLDQVTRALAWCRFEFTGPQQLYFVTLVGSALVVFVAMRLRDSRLGRAWMAMREDEDVAEAMGINLVNIKLLAYAIGGAFGGMGGAVFAVMLGSVFPHSFGLLVSINVLALIIVGGMGSLPGVIVGSLALVGLPELLREFSDFRFLVYGAVLILMMQRKPEGLWPAAAQQRELRAAEAASPGLAPAEGEAG